MLGRDKEVMEGSPIKPLEMKSARYYIQNTKSVINKRLDIEEEINRESKDKKILTNETQRERKFFFKKIIYLFMRDTEREREREREAETQAEGEAGSMQGA